MELSCECGNEEDFSEKTIMQFTVDGEGNREHKEIESTNYFCRCCGKPVETCDNESEVTE